MKLFVIHYETVVLNQVISDLLILQYNWKKIHFYLLQMSLHITVYQPHIYFKSYSKMP